MMSCLKDFPIKGKSFGQPSAYRLKEREKMTCIRPAEAKDICRLSEIEVFNYRLNFYPIFLNDEFYFSEYTVENLTSVYHQNPETLKNTCVYDDGCVKGFIRVSGNDPRRITQVCRGRNVHRLQGLCTLSYQHLYRILLLKCQLKVAHLLCSLLDI